MLLTCRKFGEILTTDGWMKTGAHFQYQLQSEIAVWCNRFYRSTHIGSELIPRRSLVSCLQAYAL